MIQVTVDYKNPAGFPLQCARSAKACSVCTSSEVVLLYAPALTPELISLLLRKVGLARASEWLLQTPMLTHCAICGHREVRNWQFVENPYFDEDMAPMRDGPRNVLDDDQEASGG